MTAQTPDESQERGASELTTLLSHVSHEIRTSLNTMVGAAHLLTKTNLSPLQSDHLQKITSAGNALLGIVTDVMDYTKLQAGSLRIVEDDFQLCDLVEQVTVSAGPAATRRQLKFIVDLDPRLPRAVRGDRLRLTQLLEYFLDLALHASERGEIVVSADGVGENANACRVRFSVRASAGSFSTAEMACLSDSVSAPAHACERCASMRLRLAVSQQLARLLGGTMAVEGVTGQDRSLVLTVRLGIAGADKQSDLMPGSARALVADANLESRVALTDLLEGMSLRVSDARSGADAVEEVRRSARAGVHFDLVYLDWDMPDDGAFVAASRIRDLQLRRQPELIIMCSCEPGDVVGKTRGLRIAEVLPKPMTPSVIHDVTREALAHRRTAAPGLRATAKARPTARPPAAFEQVRGARALVVDDHQINRLMATAILEEIGIDVDTAANGQEALNKLSGSTYDLVLIDVHMPVMDGLEAARELRQRGFRQPVIALTANADEANRELCLDSGMSDVLTKPIEPELLWRCVLDWIPAQPMPPAAAKNGPGAALPMHTGAPRLPAMDVDAGVERLRGDQDLYWSLLGRFVRQHAATPGQIHEALFNGAVAEAERLAHKLCVASSNLGLPQVEELSRALESALQTYAPPVQVQDRLRELRVCLERTLASIQKEISARPLTEARA